MTSRIRTTAVAALSLLLAVSAVRGATLNVGDAAPPLSVGKWVKGEPVASLEKGKVYVVEFWATWCGPCKATIPHVSALAKQYPDVTFIGQNVWENDVALVEPFVTQMGDKMSYRVATDDIAADGTPDSGKMATTWMKAAGQGGIPTAFIVGKDGNVVWIGHPATMDKPLAQVVAGTFDLAAAKKEADVAAAKAKEQQAAQGAFATDVVPKIQAKDFKGAAAAIDGLAAKHPLLKTELMSMKFSLLVQGKEFDAAYAASDEVATAEGTGIEALNGMAWAIADNKAFEGHRDLDRALAYATKAATLSENKEPAILDTLARIYADKGDAAKAIEWQTKAVALAEGEQKADLQKKLEKYQAKAQ